MVGSGAGVGRGVSSARGTLPRVWMLRPVAVEPAADDPAPGRGNSGVAAGRSLDVERTIGSRTIGVG